MTRDDRRQTADGGRRSADDRPQTTDPRRPATVHRPLSTVRCQTPVLGQWWSEPHLALIIAALALLLTACASAPSPPVTPLLITPSPAATSSPSPTPPPTPTASPTPLPPTPTPCPPDVCDYAGHFVLQRPIGPEFTDVIDPTYPYGSSLNGTRKTHHGVEFVNPQGTPVLAAADGVVVVAGDDFQQPYADLPGFYGNLVIIKHQVTVGDQPVTLYTLYGHLSKVLAEVGQEVKAGDVVGEVGFTGWATGEHLHFEVRQGENSFRKTRNPELWLQPKEDESGQPMGVLAAQILNEYGTSAYVPNVTVEHLDPSSGEPLAVYYRESYADWTVNGDDVWGENFVIGDLPPGRYRLSFIAYGLHTYEVEVLPGRVTLIRFDPRQE